RAARRRRERLPVRPEREHLRACDDGCREGRGPDSRQHAVAPRARAVLPPRGRSGIALNDLTVGEFLAAVGARTPAPASGAATALTGALAAALAELASRFADDEPAIARATELRSRLSELADEDAAAYTAFMKERTQETRAWIVAVPEEIAARAEEVAD